jgi:hypothetical protein
MKTTILIAIAMVLFSSNQDQSKADNYEVINTLEDMKEWMDWYYSVAIKIKVRQITMK